MNKTISRQKSGPPRYLPPFLQQSLERGPVRFSFSRPEKKIYRKRKAVPVSEWSARHRVIEIGKYKGSKYNPHLTPYTKGMMDASFFPSVRYINNCKCVQSGGSAWIHTCLGYAIDRKPGNICIVLPDNKKSGDTVRDRLIPMIEMSPRLAKYMTGRQDDKTTYRIKLINLLIYAGWSGSAASLGDFPAMYLVKEEADKWVEYASKNEAGTHDLADKRVTTYQYDSKTWDNCTPTVEAGHIWRTLTTGTQVVFNYFVRCPDCNHAQVMVFKGIVWDGGAEVDQLEVEAKKLARYVCCGCGSLWDDYKRDQAVRVGEWRGVPTKGWLKRFELLKDGDHQAMNDAVELHAYLRRERPARIGFHTPAWISPFVSLSASAKVFLDSQGKTSDARKKLKDFCNNYAAEPWKEYHKERKEDVILQLCDDRPRGRVPAGGVVAGLFGVADTQDDGFWYEIRACGYGENEESWQVREGFVQTKEALEQVLFKDRYHDADGRQYHVQMSVIDAMGHRTKEVYDFCVKWRGRIFPLQGKDKMSSPWSWSHIRYYPNSKRVIPGGVMLFQVNSLYYKDELSRKLAISPADPGAWHLRSECPDSWARQLTVEYRDDEKQIWICPEGKDNHAWDLGYYFLALIDERGVKFWPKPEQAQQDAPRQRKKEETEERFTINNFERPDWLNR